MNIKLPFTGERVVVAEMKPDNQTLLDHLARYRFTLPHCHSKIVFDLACGSGYGLEMMRKAGAIKVKGFDIDPLTIQYCKEQYPEISFEIRDFEKDQIEDTQVDLVVSFETIEHLENPNVLLDWISKHAKTFIFSIPMNLPSRFHKQVYNTKTAKKLLYKYFKNINWYSQVKTKIKPLEKQEHPKYLIGIATNINKITKH